jgi:hypothetical protein
LLGFTSNIFFISKLIIIDWSITLCDVTPENRGRFQEFRESLDKMEWESLLSDTNDIDQNWNKFNEIIKKLETMYIPTRKYRQIGKGNTFLMDVLLPDFRISTGFCLL